MAANFNYEGAKKAGYSDAEIAAYLAPQKRFNLEGAIKAGYSYSEVVDHLLSGQKSAVEKVAGSGVAKAVDIPLQVAQGAVGTTRTISDVFGAANPVSGALKGTEQYLGTLLSSHAKGKNAEVARIMKEAQDKGLGDQVMAGLKALATNPTGILAQGAGSVVPAVAASLLAVVAAPEVASASAIGSLGFGALSGAGMIKGDIYEATKTALVESGVPAERAEKAAQQAQSYGGKNLDQILLGTGIGAAAGATGLEKGVAKLLGKRILSETAEAGAEQAVKQGLGRRVAKGFVAEGAPEALQAAQERVAENVAQQREGFDVPTFRGAASSAALEGVTGGILGGGLNIMQPGGAAPTAEQPGVQPDEGEPTPPSPEVADLMAYGFSREAAEAAVRPQEPVDATREPDLGGREPSVPSPSGDAGQAVDTGEAPPAGSAGLGLPSEPAVGPNAAAPASEYSLAPPEGFTTQEYVRPTFEGFPEAPAPVAPALELAPEPAVPEMAAPPVEMAPVDITPAPVVAEPVVTPAKTLQAVPGSKRAALAKAMVEEAAAEQTPTRVIKQAAVLLAQPGNNIETPEQAVQQVEAKTKKPGAKKPVVAPEPVAPAPEPVAPEPVADIEAGAKTIQALLSQALGGGDQNAIKILKNLGVLDAQGAVDETSSIVQQINEFYKDKTAEPTPGTALAVVPEQAPVTYDDVRARAQQAVENGYIPKGLLPNILRRADAGEESPENLLQLIQDTVDRKIERTGALSGAPEPAPAFKTQLTLEEADKRLKEKAAAAQQTPEAEAYGEEAEVDYDNHPLMLEHEAKYDAALERIDDAENTSQVRALAKKMMKEGLIDEDNYINIDERIKDADREDKFDEAVSALSDELEEQRDGLRQDIESEIDEQVSSKPSSAQYLNTHPVDNSLVDEAVILARREGGRVPSLARAIRKLVKLHQRGRLSSDMLAAFIADTSAHITEQKVQAREAFAASPRVRGADFIRQRLLEAKRNGDISEEGVDFAEWAIQRNPELVDDLGISIRQQGNMAARTSGAYFPANRVMRLIKGSSSDITVVHELMHHLERMLPRDVQASVTKEWNKQRLRAARDTPDQRTQRFFDLLNIYHSKDASTSIRQTSFAEALRMVGAGEVGYKNYQYTNASEFWAVNATDILNGRFNASPSVVGRLRQWVSELFSFFTNAGGNRTVLRALRAAMGSGGTELSSSMLHEGAAHLNVEHTAPVRRVRRAEQTIDDNLEQVRLQNAAFMAGQDGAVKATKAFVKNMIGGNIKEHDVENYAGIIKDNFTGIDVGVHKLTAAAMPSAGIVDMLADVTSMETLQRETSKMHAERNNLLRGFSVLTERTRKFIKKHTQTALANAQHIARLARVDFVSHDTIVDALAQDGAYATYADLLATANTLGEKEYAKAKMKERRTELEGAYAAWDALGRQAGGKELYKTTRKFYKDMHMMTLQLQRKTIEQLDIDPDDKEILLKRVRSVQDRASDPDAKPDDQYPEVPPANFVQEYTPFMRFGKHWLRVKNGPLGPEFYMFESATELKAYERQRKAELKGHYANAEALEENFSFGHDVASLRSQLGGENAAISEIFSIIDRALANKEEDANLPALREQLYQTFLMTLPDRSINKRSLHSENRVGASMDTQRVLETSSMHYANQLTKMRYAPKIQQSIEQLKEEVNTPDRPAAERARLEIYAEELISRAREELNPPVHSAFVTALNRLAFVTLLTSGATAMTQFTAIPIRVAPHLYARYGVIKTIAILTKYSNVLNSFGVATRGPDGETSYVAPTFDQSGIARGNPRLQRAFVDLRSRGAFGTAIDSILQNERTPRSASENAPARAVRNGLNVLSVAFNASERMTREIAGMAAYELHYGKHKNHEAAIEAAIKSVDDTMGNYTTFDRPKLMRGEAMRAISLFKAYAVNTTRFFIGSAYTILKKSSTMEERAIAMKEVVGVLGVGALFHGITGMPLYSTLIPVIAAMLAAFDDDEEKERKRIQGALMGGSPDYMFRYEWMPRHFGQVAAYGPNGETYKLSDMLLGGVVPEITGANIASRTSFDGMWFRQGKEGKNWAETVQNNIFSNIAGASVGLNFIGGAEDIANGDVLRGVEKMIPAAFKGMATTYRLQTEGAETRGGDPLLNPAEVDRLNIPASLVGFQPTELSRIQNKRALWDNQIRKLEKARGDMLRDLNQARYPQDDPEKLQEVVGKIIKFNAKHPGTALEITGDTIDNSYASFMRNKERTYRGTAYSDKELPYAMEGIRAVEPN